MLLEMAAEGFGDRVAIGSADGGLTYRGLFNKAGAASERFRSGDNTHVAMADLSSVALPISLFGAAWAGLPFVPLNYRLTDEELLALTTRVSPAVVVVDPDDPDRLAGYAGIDVIERHRLLDLVCGVEPQDPDWTMTGEDTAIVLFTSGTTGQPKAAVLRHRHLVSYVLGSVEFMQASEDDAALVSVPPYHVAGIAAILSNVYAGRRVVQLPTFDAAAWVALVRAESVTSAMVVPTMLTLIVGFLDAEGPDGPGLPTLRSLSYGGGRMPLPTIRRALELLPTTAFVNAYGLTETSPVTHINPRTSALKVASVGTPLPNTEHRIVDLATMKDAPQGELGEVWIRGPQVMKGYLHNQEATREMIDEEGWLHSGDIGRTDDDGYLYVVDRVKELIKYKGLQVAPAELEAVLQSHPAVADVAVIPSPDEEAGEVPKAFVVVKPETTLTADEVIAFVAERVSPQKKVRKVEFIDAIPKVPSGKILHRTLVERERASVGSR